MRIIAGAFKGRSLVSFKADHIRPTTDRVKESLFNILENRLHKDWMDLKILDLFSGTGNLGIEAISRGAHHVSFVEKHPTSLRILKENLDLFRVEKSRYQIYKQNALAFIQAYATSEKDNVAFDLVFADPPFTKKMAHDVLSVYAQSQIWTATTVLAIESARGERLEDNYGEIQRYDARQFGDKILSFFAQIPATP